MIQEEHINGCTNFGGEAAIQRPSPLPFLWIMIHRFFADNG
jgi:hypothetical protein